MSRLSAENRQFSSLEKVIYILLGALITGAMWRMRGTHGWGSEFGVFTVGLVLLSYIYAVFKRKTNASFFHIITGSLVCMLTTPAWGTLLNQTSGFFEVSVKNDAYTGPMSASCSPISGVFIMLCLGFGAMPLFMFMVSRLFSSKKYTLINYIIVIAVFFAVFYISNATISHLILKYIQPESVKAFENGLAECGKDGTVYSVYMKHFSDINWAKKIPFGRNYFTEITVISHAIASLVTAIVIRLGLKDKVGGNITFWGCTAMSIGITASNVFFVLKNKLSVDAHPWLDNAWSFWEYFTGFVMGLILMIILFAVNSKNDDKGFSDEIFSFIPDKIKDLLLCAYVWIFGIGVSTIRPFATRLDASNILPIVVWAVGGIAIIVSAILMYKGKLPKFWNADPNEITPKLTIVLFIIHTICYLFAGYSAECPPIILSRDSIQIFMFIALPITMICYILVKRKEIIKKR